MSFYIELHHLHLLKWSPFKSDVFSASSLFWSSCSLWPSSMESGVSCAPYPTYLCLWVGLSVCLIQWKGHGCLASEASEKLSDKVFHFCAMVSPPKELSPLVPYLRKSLLSWQNTVQMLKKTLKSIWGRCSDSVGESSCKGSLRAWVQFLCHCRSRAERTNFPKPLSGSCSRSFKKQSSPQKAPTAPAAALPTPQLATTCWRRLFLSLCSK